VTAQPLTDEAAGTAPGHGRLSGRRVLVVGAGSQPCADEDAPVGNGRAIAILAAREGAKVACCDIDRTAAQETVDSIAGAGGTATVVLADVSKADQCARAVTEAADGLDGLDGLVLNVGIGLGRGMAATTPEQWDATFAVNVRAHFLCAAAALPVLAPASSVVFISSAASLHAGTGIPSYDSSKAALLGVCRQTALEGAPHGTRANVLVPGYIDTPLGRRASTGNPDRIAAVASRIPLGRQGTAWEVAYAVLWLLSNESTYMTGQSLVIDGGRSSI